MADRVLASTVYVTNPETGSPECFLAGSTPPEWAAARITNESAWEAPDLSGNETVSRAGRPAPVPLAGVKVTETPAVKPLDEMTKAELVEEAKRRSAQTGVEVDTSGTKAELLARLEG